ncbi:MAG: carboxypeptidase regulatory-like domain-containing protein [Elusimicrobiota bacterium]
MRSRTTFVRKLLRTAALKRGLGGRRGVSLVELMVAVTILSIAVLSFVSSFQYITKSIHISRARTLGTNLAQEKIENLKNLSYYKLQLSTDTQTNNDFSPALVYDTVNYPEETIEIGGITFKRGTYVAFGDVVDNEISTVTFNYPDPGLKILKVHVMWKQHTSWKRITLQNLFENPNIEPLNATLTGTVEDEALNPVSGALVKVLENPDWSDTTDALGEFSFRLHGGTYTMRASSAGYNDKTNLQVYVSTTGTSASSFTLTAIGSGTIVGNAWLNTGLLITQIVASSTTRIGGGTDTKEVEYVELFNPTTYPIDIGSSAFSKSVKVDYKGEKATAHDKNDTDFNLTYVSTYVASGGYYLIASTGSFYILGSLQVADAYYGSPNADYIKENDAGCFSILDASDDSVIDRVGWCDDTTEGAFPYCKVDNGCYEGTPIPDSSVTDGLSPGKQIVRISSPLLVSDVYGRAYDSGSNIHDFIFAWQGEWDGEIIYEPHSSVDPAQTVLAGVPAVGAHVTADDLLGAATQAYAVTVTSGSSYGLLNPGPLYIPYAAFELEGVSTGTWNVIVASGSYQQQFASATVTLGAPTPVPNATTTPAWVLAGLPSAFLSTSTVQGYIAGAITGVNDAPLTGIVVSAAGENKTTGSNGRYFAQVSSGAVSVVVNPNNADTTYVEYISQADIQTGQITTLNVVLTEGGVISGYASTDGVSPLPNVQFTAEISGVQYGTATTDESGTFYIKNLATGTYTVQPALESAESSDPLDVDVSVSYTETVDVGTFTITGALGTLSGNVTHNGQRVTTGALILASKAAISATPPEIVASSSPAQTVIYAASSLADGTYEMDIRGSDTDTYYVSAYVPIIAGDSVSITTKTYSGITITRNASTTHDIEVP